MTKRRGEFKEPFVIFTLNDLRHQVFLSLTPAQRCIYIEMVAMASYQNQRRPCPGDKVKESYSLLRKHTGLTSATISRALKALMAEGFIKRVGEPGKEMDTLRRGWMDTCGEYELLNNWRLG